MTNIETRISKQDWNQIAHELTEKGFVSIKNFLSQKECLKLIKGFDESEGFRKTVTMERYRFGKGAYKYWSYPLPSIIEKLRVYFYPNLAPIANSWMEMLNIERRYPDSLNELLKECRNVGQSKPTPLILSYKESGFNTLHQDLYGDTYFPIQIAFFLNDPQRDFSGGHFVLTEQVPRAQSRAIVLSPNIGDAIIFTTNFRPKKGKRGYYRITMKHGVSEVSSGERHTVGIIFHDAKS